MAKTMAKIKNGVVMNIAVFNDDEPQSDNWIDMNDLPVNINDTYDGADFYRDGEKVLSIYGMLEAAYKKLTAENSKLKELYEKFKALSEMTYWAELDSGASIAVGDVVRYFGKNYKCIKAHTKALIRFPKNFSYWEEVEDDS